MPHGQSRETAGGKQVGILVTLLLRSYKKINNNNDKYKESELRGLIKNHGESGHDNESQMGAVVPGNLDGSSSGVLGHSQKGQFHRAVRTGLWPAQNPTVARCTDTRHPFAVPVTWPALRSDRLHKPARPRPTAYSEHWLWSLSSSLKLLEFG